MKMIVKEIDGKAYFTFQKEDGVDYNCCKYDILNDEINLYLSFSNELIDNLLMLNTIKNIAEWTAKDFKRKKGKI